MEALFRLALVRPAIAQDPANPSIRIRQESPFQSALTSAGQTERPRDAIQRVARTFVAGADFIGDPAATPVSAELSALASELDALERTAQVSQADVAAAIESEFGATPRALVESHRLDGSATALRDSLLAIKQLQEEHGRPIEQLANQLRDIELILRVASDDAFPASPAALARYRRRSLALPPTADLRSVISSRAADEKRRRRYEKQLSDRTKRAGELFDRYQRLGRAVAELTSLGAEHLHATVQQSHEGFMPPDGLRLIAGRSRQTALRDKASDVAFGQFHAAIERGNVVDPLKVQEMAGAVSAAALIGSTLTAERPLAGRTAFSPVPPGESSFRLKASATEALSESTRELLAEQRLVVSDHPLDRLVSTLQAEVEGLRKEIEPLYGHPMHHSVKRFGDTLVTISTPIPTAWANVTAGLDYAPPLPVLAEERIPHSRGQVGQPSVADLLVIKQQLVRYEPADVAHIENVLKGEGKVREHTRRQESEELRFRETERTSSEEHELESTDRFEMTRETNATIREDAALKAGLTISGKYGPTVDFSASAEGSMSRSKEEATKTASAYSQEVTERSATKVTERVLERSSLRVTNEVIEKNTHTLTNTDGTGHISGVYQWVNKVYHAQMFNYGLRAMFDFMVPEPGAFVIEALKSASASAADLQKPPEFPLKPNEITEANHPYWVRIYGATDVTPPPEMYTTKSLDYHAGEGDKDVDFTHSGQITIDDGYRAVQGSVGCAINVWESSWSVEVVLGRRLHRFASGGSLVWTTSMDDERASVPLALNTNYVSDVGWPWRSSASAPTGRWTSGATRRTRS